MVLTIYIFHNLKSSPYFRENLNTIYNNKYMFICLYNITYIKTNDKTGACFELMYSN